VTNFGVVTHMGIGEGRVLGSNPPLHIAQMLRVVCQW